MKIVAPQIYIRILYITNLYIRILYIIRNHLSNLYFAHPVFQLIPYDNESLAEKCVKP